MLSVTGCSVNHKCCQTQDQVARHHFISNIFYQFQASFTLHEKTFYSTYDCYFPLFNVSLLILFLFRK